jgi:putative DNA-invertase from lambdoid prophage Rac
VSKKELATANQVHQIQASGFAVEPHRVIEETISGASAAKQRPGFAKLLDRLENGDVLIVTKLDRLGRDVVDVVQTVQALEARGVRVHCLQLGGADLTSAAGKLTMNVLTAVAQFERDLLIERTMAGLARTKAQGTKLGRKPKLTDAQRSDVQEAVKAGKSIAKTARSLGVSRQTIARALEVAA